MARYFGLAAALAAMCFAGAAAAQSLDTAAIEKATGLKGSLDRAEGVFKVSLPRRDVNVRIEGWPVPPFMGLTSWAAFAPQRGGHAMVMGDIVLFEDEVNAAMSAALDSGLDVTALHNHFFFDRPKVYFMHIGGMGDTEKLASGVRAVFDAVKEVRERRREPADAFLPLDSIPERSAISAEPLERIFGTRGQSSNGMFKVTFGRTALMHGAKAGGAMGVATWAGFAGSDDNAVIDGDIAMRESELQAVLRALRHEGINVVAIHQHMSGEQPRYLFLHFWGRGRAQDLAHALRRTLDRQGQGHQGHH